MKGVCNVLQTISGLIFLIFRRSYKLISCFSHCCGKCKTNIINKPDYISGSGLSNDP